MEIEVYKALVKANVSPEKLLFTKADAVIPPESSGGQK